MKPRKNPLMSVTLWGAFLSLVGLMIRLFGHEVPWLAELWDDPATRMLIGEVLAALGVVGVTWGRVRPGAGVPVTRRQAGEPDPDGVARLTPKGFSRTWALVAFMVIGWLLIALLPSCSHQRCPDGVRGVAEFQGKAPGFLRGRCAGDDDARVSLQSRGVFHLAGVCDPGEKIGCEPGSQVERVIGGKPAVVCRITCVGAGS